MTLIVQVVVGTAEEIRSGQGECVVTVAQAAVRLGISVASVRLLLDSGVLTPCARFGNTQLYRERDVERLRADREKSL